MKFRIYLVYALNDDYVDVEGDTIEEIQEKAMKIINERDPEDYWSRQLED